MPAFKSLNLRSSPGVTLTLTFHKDPKMIGTIHRLVNKNMENGHNCGLIDPTGNTKGQGSAIIIKKFKLLLYGKICIFTHGYSSVSQL